MKQRITYVVRDLQEGVDPATLAVSKDSLKIPGLDAAKEWRITVGAKELPKEIWEVLQQTHELHIRWASSRHYQAVSPLVSRTPPGLHVFFTPRKEAESDNLCNMMMNTVFGQLLVFSYIVRAVLNVCSIPILPAIAESADQVAALESATTVDFDFDAISHALKLTAVWAQAPGGGVWSETIRLQSTSDTIEVGILNTEKATEPEELSLGGFLIVLGEDGKPSPTLFSFPSRHHPLPPSSLTNYKTSFRQPTGLHPTLQLTFPAASLTPPAETCSLHAYLTLPKTLFVDRYQLSDPLFLASQNLISLRSLSGETDLEAPVWVIKRWGSAALLELAVPADPSAGAGAGSLDWEVSLPLHLRYLEPSSLSSSNTSTSDASGAKAGQRIAPVPWPAVFWACEAEEGLKMSVNPFDRVNLGYDGLFGPKTMFYHVPPAEGAQLIEEVSVPVLDLQQSRYVEIGTALVVLLGFAWVCWQLRVGSKADQKRTTAAGEKDAGKKKM
ncbi:hypothetical protein MBLNU459_g5358t1 [Dothideomycetes sp. NU459]